MKAVPAVHKLLIEIIQIYANVIKVFMNRELLNVKVKEKLKFIYCKEELEYIFMKLSKNKNY